MNDIWNEKPLRTVNLAHIDNSDEILARLKLEMAEMELQEWRDLQIVVIEEEDGTCRLRIIGHLPDNKGPQ